MSDADARRRIDVAPGPGRPLTLADGRVAEDAPLADKRHGSVQVGRQRIRVSLVSEGAGRPLLLINGLGATGDLWDDFRAHLTERESIAFDAPGIGGSPAPGWMWRLPWFAKKVSGLIGELGHRQVDVMGLSWGGALAQELAIRHPDQVRRLVLAGTTPGVISVPGTPAAIAILMTPLRYYSTGYLEAVAPTLYGGAIRQNPELLRRHAHVRATHPPSPQGYVTQMMALRRWSSLPRLPGLKAPTLVMAGDDDPIVPLTNGRLIARMIPNSRLHVVKGGGHMFVFTRAQEIAGIVRDFLDEA